MDLSIYKSPFCKVPHYDVKISLLRTWESGICHTYNPQEELSPIFDHRIGLFLGHQNMNSRTEYNFAKFTLYIHEKGDFWPKGYFFATEIFPGDYKVLSFSTKVEFKVLFYYI